MAQTGQLNQIVALVKGIKSRTMGVVTELYHKLQAKTLFEGIARTYRSRDEDGDQLPAESKKVQFTVRQAIRDATVAWTALFDTVLTQDVGNCAAVGDIKPLDRSAPLLTHVPVTHLLFLEKQLTDVRSFVEKLPTLDPAYTWKASSIADVYATDPVDTARTKKILRNHVKAEATKEHPAQVDVYPEDVVAGYWTKTDFSGAIPAVEKSRILDRINVLMDAVKSAREEANGLKITGQNEGAVIFGYISGTTETTAS